MLRADGYRTAYFGKWGLGHTNPGCFDVWDAFNSRGGHWADVGEERRYKPDIQTDHCLEFLEGAARAAQPFVMVQSYYPPHDPYTAPEEFYGPYRGRGVPFPGYYAAVSAIDFDAGRILRALDDLGLAEDTVVMYFTDHGDTFGYREEGAHNSVCFDDAIHIPMIARCPGRIAGGLTVDAVVGLQDVMPTVLDWAGWPCSPTRTGAVSVRGLRGRLRRGGTRTTWRP